MSRLTQNRASTPEDSGEGNGNSPEAVLGDFSRSHQITSSAWEGWWWGNPETQLD